MVWACRRDLNDIALSRRAASNAVTTHSEVILGQHRTLEDYLKVLVSLAKPNSQDPPL